MTRRRIYEILETANEQDPASRVFIKVLTLLITANVVAVIVQTVESIQVEYAALFDAFELVSVAFFSVELMLRIITCTENPRFNGPVIGRLRFLVSPMALVDIAAIAPFFLPLAFPLDLRAIRLLRLFRLFRVLKMARYARSFQTFRRVLRDRREELVIALTFALALLVVASSVLYFAEHDAQPEIFSSIPAAMWWGIATLTTVGYGDIYPVTALGRFLGAIVAVVGVGLFALPAGIIASGFTEQLSAEREGAQGGRRCPHCGKEI